MTDWTDLTRRASFASHRLIGWIFWDERARANLEALGVPGGLGHYIVNRAAPLAAAGPDAVFAAFYTIKRDFITLALGHASAHVTDWHAVTRARDAAVRDGLGELAPSVIEPLGGMAPDLWRTVDALPASGRVLFAAHRSWTRPEDPVTGAWNALNCIREWRGDTHFAILVNDGIGMVEAGLLHDAWMGYPREWIPRSRGADDGEISAALDTLARRGFVTDGGVNAAGAAYRQEVEDRTDAACGAAWRLLGAELTERFLSVVEPVDEVFVARIDATAGENWMPAARRRRR